MFHVVYYKIFKFVSFYGVGPTNMLGHLPSKKYQIDLRPFSVGVLIVGRMVSP